jgi:hypothetical protein
MNSLNNSKSHHIVAGNHSGAEKARLLLKEEGIDINEASNGVFLPMNSKYIIEEASSHQNIHTKVYYETVYNRLGKVNKEDIRDELQKIADELSNETFPY